MSVKGDFSLSNICRGQITMVESHANACFISLDNYKFRWRNSDVYQDLVVVMLFNRFKARFWIITNMQTKDQSVAMEPASTVMTKS